MTRDDALRVPVFVALNKGSGLSISRRGAVENLKPSQITSSLIQNPGNRPQLFRI